jgi:hypothetical protein
MGEYQPGQIECEPAPAVALPEDENLDPRPPPDEACGPSYTVTRPRDPDDEGDPGAQGEEKRPRLDLEGKTFPDLNLPADQQGTGRASEVGGTSRQKLIFEHPDPHVELQTHPFWFLMAGPLTYLFAQKVRYYRPHKIICHEVYRVRGHDGEL